VSDLVAQVRGRGRLERANQVEFDVLRGKVVEEPSALAEQHRPELNLYGVEDPRLEGLLGVVGAVHETSRSPAAALACSTQAAMPARIGGRLLPRRKSFVGITMPRLLNLPRGGSRPTL
jgi:hypothetical protein